MSPVVGALLVDSVVPIIAATVPHAVKTVGAEDVGELVQDTVVMAAQILDSCEARGKAIIPNSIAFYAISLAKTGRRSYGATRTDAMCPAAQLDGNATIASMDEEIPDEQGEGLTFHDMLAAPVEDPAQQAGRAVDWSALMDDLSDRDLAVLRATVNGDHLDRLAAQLGVSAPRVTQIKRAVGQQIRTRWGETALGDVTRSPLWAGTINAGRERAACRLARAW